MNCPKCGRENAPGVRFCGYCGADIVPAPTTCPRCQATNAPGMRFCGQCGYPFSQGPNEPTIVTTGKAPPPPPMASPPRSSSGGGGGRNGAFFGVVGLLAACLLFICAGAGLVGAQQFGIFGGSTPTAVARAVASATPVAGTPAPVTSPTAGGPPPAAATPTPAPAAPTPEPALKPQYEKGESASMGGATLTLTDFKADIGSILNQRARLDSTFTFRNDSQAPIAYNLPGQSFTVLVLEDRFDASTVNPASGNLNPGETATINVSFTVTGGLQKFISVKEVFIVANQVGPVAGPKWRLPFGR